jgi:hypothetical protein
VTLNGEQQQHLERVAGTIYRPCCNNATLFPDCNHGMALLGLLELMAAQGASETQMYDAAKYVSALWFPEQMAEVATYTKVHDKADFAAANGAQLLDKDHFSGSGFQSLHQWLVDHGYVNQPQTSGAACNP